MKKLKVLELLKKKSNSLHNKYIKENKPLTADIYVTINKLLDIPNSFEHLGIETALEILTDLQFSTKDSLKIYNALIH